MVKAESIHAFFQTPPVAVIGVSRKKNHFGDVVYETLKKRGLKVIPINPNADKTQGGDVCYPNLKSLPNKVDAAVILTAAKNTDAVVKEAIEYGIKNLWIQQKSETKSAIETAEKNNINVIHHQCILMFSEPVTGFHKFHRNIKKLFGKLPK